MYWSGHDMFGWGYPLGLIGIAVFWAAVIFGIVALVRYAGRSRHQASEPGRPPAAEQLLAERFARGEIEEEEYRSRLAALRAGGPGPAERAAGSRQP